MSVILVTLPAGSPATTKNDVNAMLVVASDAAEALLIASEYAALQGMDGAKQAFAAASTQVIGAGEGVWATSKNVTVFAAAQATASSD